MTVSSSKTILAIDSSTKACSVALQVGDDYYSRHEILPQKHAHRILPMVDEVVNEAGIVKNDIDLLCFGQGPGAFTGIRIAAGVVQGLAIGLDKPVLGLSSLTAMVQESIESMAENSDFSSTQHFAALLDARMNEVYLQIGVFNPQVSDIEFNDPLMLSPEDAASYLTEYQSEHSVQLHGCGDIENEYPMLVTCFSSWSEMLPNALYLVKLAQFKQQQAKHISEEIPVPVYLRNQIADTIEERKRKKQANN